MKEIRTILIAVNDITSEVVSNPAGYCSAHEAQVYAEAFAVKSYPKLNYWYRAIQHYQGSRLAIVHCTLKGT